MWTCTCGTSNRPARSFCFGCGGHYTVCQVYHQHGTPHRASAAYTPKKPWNPRSKSRGSERKRKEDAFTPFSREPWVESTPKVTTSTVSVRSGGKGKPGARREEEKEKKGDPPEEEEAKVHAQALMDAGVPEELRQHLKKWRDHTWLHKQAAEVQGPAYQMQGNGGRDRSEVEDLCRKNQGKLDPTEGIIQGPEEGSNEPVEGCKGKAGGTKKGSVRKSSQHRGNRDRRRGRGTGRRRSGRGEGTLGRRRRRGEARDGRGGRDNGQCGEEKRGLGALWKKTQEAKILGDRRKGIERAPDFQRQDLSGEYEWTIPHWGTHSNAFKHMRWPRCKGNDGSQELAQMAQAVRREERGRREEAREEARRQLEEDGGIELWHEINALLADPRREGIPIWVYVLDTRHRETFHMRATRDQRTPEDVVISIEEEVRRRNPGVQRMRIVFVQPQPPPFWRDNEDAIHVIANVIPQLGGVAVLVAKFVNMNGDLDFPELESLRVRDQVTCRSMIISIMQQEPCTMRMARCTCTKDWVQREERQVMAMREGDRVDIRRHFEVMEEEEGEEYAFMVTRNMRRKKMNAGYAYQVEEAEPRYFVGRSLDKQEMRWHIWETYTSSPTTDKEKNYEVFEVRPNPEDLESKGIQGYILEEAGVRAPTQTVILLDVEVYPNVGLTTDGRRTVVEEWRAVERIHERLTRLEFLKELKILSLCRESGTCIILMGGKPWREGDPDPWILSEGTYGVVKILNQKPDIPLDCQWRWAQKDVEVEGFEEQWKKEKKRRRRREEEDEEEESLIQTSRRPSAASQARGKLPPPGNGERREVTFQDEISCKGNEGYEARLRDLAISNEFIRNTKSQMEDLKWNPFAAAFVEGMRYDTLEKDGDDSAEDDNPGFLPLRTTQREEEQPIDDYEEEAPGKEECTRGEERREVKQVELYEALRGHKDWDDFEEEGEGMDFRPVLRFAEWFNTHMTIPKFQVDNKKWKQESTSWINAPIWQNTRCQQIHIYTDGSVKEKRGGSSAVLFTKDEWGWNFGGYVDNWETEDTGKGKGITIYQMELDALILGLKWCHDIAKLHMFEHGTYPECYIHFDSFAAGYGTSGNYSGNPSEKRYVIARSIHQAICSGMGVNLKLSHVKAHRGNPGNEAADVLAEAAQQERPERDEMMRSMKEGSGSLCIQWLWWLYRGDIFKFMKDGRVKIPKVKARVEEEVVKQLRRKEDEEEKEETRRFDLKIVTYNVNTMRGEGKEPEGLGGYGTLEAQLKILHEEGVHVAVFQETRLKRRLNDCNKWYHLHQEEANPKGQGGILVAISRHHQIDQEGTIVKEDVKYVEGDKERMVIKIKNEVIRVALVAGHAPHAGYEEEDIRRWWDETTRLAQEACKGWDIISALDANAKVGGRCSEHIGECQQEGENIPGEAFHQYLTSTQQWAPATFEQCQEGQGYTITYPNGTQSRLDYVCIPVAWGRCRVTNRVRDDLSNRTTLYDHRPVECTVQGWTSKTRGRRKRTKKPDFNIKEKWKKELFEKYLWEDNTTLSWDTDIHVNVQRMNNKIISAARKVEKEERGCKKMKEYLREDTWEMIQEKRIARKKCFESRDAKRRRDMRYFFEAWRTRRRPEKEKDEKEGVKIIKEEEEFKRLSREVTKKVRRDDRDFFEALAKQMKEKEETKEAAGLWKCIRRHIPKWRERKRMRDPGKDEKLSHKWDAHMKKLEAAIPRGTEEVYRKCVERQSAYGEVTRPLKATPTLLQVEQVLRESKTGKCGGTDMISPDWLHHSASHLGPMVWQITMKGFAWADEAVQHKGGRLVMIGKQPGSREPDGYRPIMLLSSVGRRIHALMRQELMAELEKEKKEGQLGGFRGQEPVFGSHFTRTVLRIAQAKGFSSGVIYLDLKAAYHSMVRQAVLGESKHEEARKEEEKNTMDNIKEAGGNVKEVMRRISQATYLEKMKVPVYTRQHLHEVGESNWADLHDRQYQTFKGTRPGSPLADAIFHTSMAEIQEELQKAMDDQEVSQRTFQDMRVRGRPITWADDVSTVILSKRVEDLDPMIESLATIANRLFRSRGMELNFKSAKSEVMTSYKGQGAGEKRRRLLTGEDGAHEIPQEDERKNTMKTVGRYKHLGTVHQAGGNMDEELKYRCDQAWAVWRQLAKPVMKNKHLKTKTRLGLLNSLIFTRLFYGAGAWPILGHRQLKRIETTMMKMIREVMNRTTKKGGEHWTDRTVLMEAELPGVRARIAKERLTYATRFFGKAEEFIQEAMWKEEEVRPDSWIRGLRMDLEWMNEVIEGWPDDLEDVMRKWREGDGWKKDVKKALRKHIAQEGLSMRLEEKLRKEGAEFEEARDDKKEQWTCECGTHHKTKAGLAAHRRLKHDLHGDEFEFGAQTRCLVCLKEFWSVARFRQHVGYIPRGGQANRCFCIYKAKRLKDEEDKEEQTRKKEVMKGINRKESIKIHGPKILGSQKDDKVWLEEEVRQAEERLEEKLGKTLEDLSGDDKRGQIEDTYQEEGLDGVIQYLQDECLEDGKSAFQLCLWGKLRSWTKKEEEEEWLETARGCQGSEEILYWMQWKKELTDLEIADRIQPHKEVNLNASQKERAKREEGVRRHLRELTSFCVSIGKYGWALAAREAGLDGKISSHKIERLCR